MSLVGNITALARRAARVAAATSLTVAGTPGRGFQYKLDEEVDTGSTWIDGKPIYVRVVSSSATYGYNGWANVADCDYVDTLVDADYGDSDGTNHGGAVTIRVNATNGKLQLYHCTIPSRTLKYVIIWYTRLDT